MAENFPLDVSTWIRKLGPEFKDSITPYGLSCIFPYHQIRVDEPFLRVATNYQVPSQHVFRFNRIELCPIVEEFVAIMAKPEIDDHIFPTMGRDLPSLLQVMVGIPSTEANRWCVFRKLNLSWFLSIFLVLPFPMVRGHTRTFIMLLACMLLQRISWFKTCIVWTFRCA